MKEFNKDGLTISTLENALINHYVFTNLFVDECTTIDWLMIYVLLNR